MFNILSVYLWFLIISPLSAVLAMMIRIPSHVVSVTPQTRAPLLEHHRQAGTSERQGDGPFGEWAPFPPGFQYSVFSDYGSSVIIWFQTSPDQSPLLLFFSLSSAHPILSPEVCVLYSVPYTWYLCLLRNLVRMLWGLSFFPNKLFPESKYYEGGQIISNYNLQKMRELSQETEEGEATYRNICKKTNILFFFF